MNEPIVLLVNTAQAEDPGKEMSMSDALRRSTVALGPSFSIYSKSRLYFWNFSDEKWDERTAPDTPSHPFPPDEVAD